MDIITIQCTKCKKVLFRGTTEQAKRLAIYCTACEDKAIDDQYNQIILKDAKDLERDIVRD